jgi:uncharacterized protein
MYLIKNLLIPLAPEYDLRSAVARKFKLDQRSIQGIEILRKALDARKKNNLKYNFTLLIEEMPFTKHPDLISYQQPQPYITEQVKLNDINPFIIGAGPAGLFAALALVEKGLKPVIFDRGDILEKRTAKVNDFWKKGLLDENSNVQFGEGGAGTFSDGKLTSRNRDYYSQKIFELLIRFGADEAIKYDALPHLGTDKLKIIIKNIRNYLISKGCIFNWNHKLENIVVEGGKITAVKINETSFRPEILILAVGNAARHTFELLNQIKAVEAKPFAVGVRIEHPQHFINDSLYGKNTDLSLTGAATYRLTSKIKDKGVYSFCMCPGGFVIGTCTEKDHLVVNGMSYNKRSNNFANSAIVVSVNETDFGKNALAGMEFQRKIEQNSFNPDFPYFAPIQSAKDFCNGIRSLPTLTNSYRPGVNSIDINKLFPGQISAYLKSGINHFNHKIPGFIQNGILVAPETRTSSPVRIVRDNSKFHSIAADNLYPIGEGSGYAGGIISSAADGFKTSQIFRY